MPTPINHLKLYDRSKQELAPLCQQTHAPKLTRTIHGKVETLLQFLSTQGALPQSNDPSHVLSIRITDHSLIVQLMQDEGGNLKPIANRTKIKLDAHMHSGALAQNRAILDKANKIFSSCHCHAAMHSHTSQSLQGRTTSSQEVDALRAELANTKSTLSQYEGQLTQSRNELSLKSDLITQLEEKIKSQKKSNASLQQQLKNQRNQTTILNSALEAAKTRMAKQAGTISKLNGELKYAKEEVTNLQTTLQGKETELNSVKDELTAAQEHMTNLGAEVNELKNQLSNKDTEIAQLTSSLETAKTQMDTQTGAITRLEDELKSATQQATTLQTTLQGKETELNSVKDELATAQGNVTSLNEQVEALTVETVSQQAQIGSLSEELKNSNQENTAIHRQMNQLRGENAQQKARIQSLEKQNSSLEGRAAELTTENERLENQIKEKQSKISQLTSRNTQLNSQLKQEKETSHGLRKSLDENTRQLEQKKKDQTALQTTLRNKQNELEELTQKHEADMLQISAITTAAQEKLQQEIARLQAEQQRNAITLQEQQTIIDGTQDQLTRAEKSVDRLTRENQQIQSSLTALQSDLDQANQTIQSQERNLSAAGQRIFQLEAPTPPPLPSLNSNLQAGERMTYAMKRLNDALLDFSLPVSLTGSYAVAHQQKLEVSRQLSQITKVEPIRGRNQITVTITPELAAELGIPQTFTIHQANTPGESLGKEFDNLRNKIKIANSTFIKSLRHLRSEIFIKLPDFTKDQTPWNSWEDLFGPFLEFCGNYPNAIQEWTTQLDQFKAQLAAAKLTPDAAKKLLAGEKLPSTILPKTARELQTSKDLLLEMRHEHLIRPFFEKMSPLVQYWKIRALLKWLEVQSGGVSGKAEELLEVYPPVLDAFLPPFAQLLSTHLRAPAQNDQSSSTRRNPNTV